MKNMYNVSDMWTQRELERSVYFGFSSSSGYIKFVFKVFWFLKIVKCKVIVLTGSQMGFKRLIIKIALNENGQIIDSYALRI